MRTIRILLSCLLLGIFLTNISGCASALHSVPSDFKFDDQSNYGLVIASTKWLDPGDRNFDAYVRKYPGFHVHTPFLVRNTFLKRDFENPPGYFYIKKFEAGSYHIYHPELMTVSEIHFDVKPGEIVYIGELEFRPVFDCGDGPKRNDCVGGYINAVVPSVKNRWERDKELTKQRLLNYSVDSVVTRLAKTR